MPRPDPTELPTRSTSEVVPAYPGSGDTFTSLLSTQALCPANRLIHVEADGSFFCRLRWSAGGRTAQVDLTSSRSIKVCVFARSVEVLVRHLNTAAPLVASTFVVDAYQPTENHFQVLADATGATAPATVSIPAYAHSVRLEMDDPATYASLSYVDLLDVDGVLRSRTFANAQPEGWIPLAGAHTLQVKCDTKHRLIFRLNL